MIALIRNHQKKITPYTPLVIFGLLVFISLTVYTLTAARYPVGFGDSDEIMINGYFFSPNHPPGYPLQSLLTYLFTHLPIPGSVAFKASLVSAVFQSLTVGILFYISLYLISLAVKKAHTTLTYCASAAASLFLAFTPLFWTYATVAEVFALNNFLCSVIVLLALQLFQDRKARWDFNKKRKLYLTFIIFGLALAHHQTSIFILPLLIILLLPVLAARFSIRRLLYPSIVGAVAFMSSIALLLVTSDNSPLTWQHEHSIAGIQKMVLRDDFKAAQDTTISGAYFSGIYLPESQRALKHWFTQYFFRDFPWLILPLIVSGGYYLWKNIPKRVSIALLVLLILTGPLIGFYLTIPAADAPPAELTMITGITERMYLLGSLWFIPFLAAGLYFYLSAIPVCVHHPRVAFLACVLPGLFLFTNFQSQDLSRYRAVYEYAQTLLKQTEPSSVVVCFSDISCFSLAYVQSIDTIRPDVALIPVTSQLQQSAVRRFPELFTVSYLKNPNRVAGIISWSMYLNRDVYLAELPSSYVSYLGLEGEVFFLQPWGFSYKLVKTPPKPDTLYPDATLTELGSHKQLFFQAFKAMLFQQHLGNATIFARMTAKNLAGQELESATVLIPENQLARDMVSQLPAFTGDPRYQAAMKPHTSESILAKGAVFPAESSISFIRPLEMAVMLEPANIELRSRLYSAYMLSGSQELAQEELLVMKKLTEMN